MAVNATRQQPSPTWTAYQWGIICLFFLAMVFAYMDRVNISTVIPVLIKQYHLTKPEAGWLLSSFNWVYTFSLLAAGPLIDRFRSRWLLTFGEGLWSVATFMSGIAANLGLLVVARGLLGAGEAALFPGAARVVSETYRKEDRSKVLGMYISGTKVGPVIGLPLAAMILAASGWHAVFYVTGAISLIWVILWLLIYRPNRGLLADSNQRPEHLEAKVPWSKLLQHRSTWGIMLAQFGYLYIFYVFLTWLPAYFVLSRHLTVLKTGIVASLPFIASFVTVIAAGWVADALIKRTGDVTRVRKGFIVGGLVLATLFVILAAYATATGAAVLFLILSMACVGCATACLNSQPIDLAPRTVVASLTSLQNFFGNLGGALAPVVTGYLYASTGNFRIPLLVTGAVALVFGAGATLFLTGKLEPSVGVVRKTAESTPAAPIA